MARSRRKIAILGNTSEPSEKKDKRRANRALRVAVRGVLAKGDEVMPVIDDVSNVATMAKDGRRWIDARDRPSLLRK